MAHIIRCLIILAFISTSFAGAAQAMPCPHMMKMQQEKLQMKMAMSDQMPCHDMAKADTEKQSPSKKHCHGLCLCGSLVASAAIVAPELLASSVVFSGHIFVPALQDVLVSRATAPPLRPPRKLS